MAERDVTGEDAPDTAGLGERPDRDPVALAAWRHVAERRRRRAGADPAGAGTEIVDDIPIADVPDVVRAEVRGEVGDPIGGDPTGEVAAAEVAAAEGAAAEGTGIEGTGTDRRGAVSSDDVVDGGLPDTDGRHETLLSLAGRIDDDALFSVRELVAIEDDAAAAELLGGCLLAAGAGVTARERAVLERWFAASRVDPELVDALPRDPEADRREEHRFTPDPPPAAGSSRDAGEPVARAAARLPGVSRVRQCWRTTPAGSAPGPVPHRVVLVETTSAENCEHVAHHVAHAARELGAVSVEVFAVGAELPDYHRAAVRAARALGDPGPDVSGTAPLGASASPLSFTATAPSPAAPSPAAPPPAGPSAAGPAPALPCPPVAGSGAEPADSEPPSPDPEPDFWSPEPSDQPGADAPTEPRPSHPDDEQYRTVASAGPDPLARTQGARGHGDSTEPDTVAPEAPAPVDLDPESAAERIAALWRTPPPDEILSNEHPISSWTQTPLRTGGPPGTAASPDTDLAARPHAEPDRGTTIDPDAATGEFPAVREPSGDRRARHSRSDTGEFEAPAVDTAGPVPPDPMSSDPLSFGPLPPVPPTSPEPTRTNGHHHDPEGGDAAGDAVTGPVHRPADIPAAPGDTPLLGPPLTSPTPPTPPTPAASAASGSSGPDSVDSQLSDRERELLARLHEGLASRERLEADAPDPLTGRPVAPPGSADATAPRTRPTTPHPGAGRPSDPHRAPPGPTDEHRPVNGHGLPRRRDHEAEDGTSPGA